MPVWGLGRRNKSVEEGGKRILVLNAKGKRATDGIRTRDPLDHNQVL